MVVNINNNNNINNAPFGNVNSSNKESKTIDARQLSLGVNPIDEKRMSARKQAMKLITDAWGRDDKLANSIKDMQDEKAVKAAEIIELKSKANDLENEKEKWRQEYGVSEDSQEYKDYKLLEKYQNNKTGAAFDKFSDDEIERLKELQSAPLTDFQKKALQLNGAKDALDVEIDRGENELIAMNASISMAKSEQDKSQDMLKAQKASEQILDAASKDIIGMLVDEAKEHIEETAEEEKEKADKAKEEKEKLEERIDKTKEKREDGEKLVESQIEAEQLELDHSIKSQAVDHVAEAQKSIAKLMENNHMINEDIKGIEIDLNF